MYLYLVLTYVTAEAGARRRKRAAREEEEEMVEEAAAPCWGEKKDKAKD